MIQGSDQSKTALFLRENPTNISCFFNRTHSNAPDMGNAPSPDRNPILSEKGEFQHAVGHLPSSPPSSPPVAKSVPIRALDDKEPDARKQRYTKREPLFNFDDSKTIFGSSGKGRPFRCQRERRTSRSRVCWEPQTARGDNAYRSRKHFGSSRKGRFMRRGGNGSRV